MVFVGNSALLLILMKTTYHKLIVGRVCCLAKFMTYIDTMLSVIAKPSMRGGGVLYPALFSASVFSASLATLLAIPIVYHTG